MINKLFTMRDFPYVFDYYIMFFNSIEPYVFYLLTLKIFCWLCKEQLVFKTVELSILLALCICSTNKQEKLQ